MIMQNFLKTSLTATVLAFLFASCDKEEIIPASELPTEITTFISTHFPDNTIVQAIIDKDGLTKTYDILEKILQYVATNYPSNFITDWELEGKNQQVQLDNGLDLEFNMEGGFLRVDS
ncbi:MAG: PepSY-like domain-containing protein [Sphingobacteriales bacterium]|nr:PepSY-like domain-containing protein [Sphingobacteriales bacterium]